MTQPKSRIQVLLVDDEPDDLRQYVRDFPRVFSSRGIEADIHPCEDFDDAFGRVLHPLHRYDLVVSDTYRGLPTDRDAQVLRMVETYRGSRFCPLVVYSSGPKPPELREGAFVVWADKDKSGDIERAMNRLLDTHIPQLARQLHEELERSTGSYLWSFLEDRWHQLNDPSPLGATVLERIIRRRAAIQIGDMDPSSGMIGLVERHAPEYYVYPPFEQPFFNLGDILRSELDATDWRVLLTPRCHLFKQENQERPRADHVLLVKAVKAEDVLGEKLNNAKNQPEAAQQKKLGAWARSPAKTERQPEGRHWYLPGFLDIPHSFCDFLQVDSVPYEEMVTGFRRIATLMPPYAEALQSCFVGFYASVGIPSIHTESIGGLLT